MSAGLKVGDATYHIRSDHRLDAVLLAMDPALRVGGVRGRRDEQDIFTADRLPPIFSSVDADAEGGALVEHIGDPLLGRHDPALDVVLSREHLNRLQLGAAARARLPVGDAAAGPESSVPERHGHELYEVPAPYPFPSACTSQPLVLRVLRAGQLVRSLAILAPS